MTLSIVDPIPSVLQHYQLELTETLDRIGQEYRIAPSKPAEGRAGVLGKAAMAAAGISNLLANRGNRALQIWPSFGLLEARLWSPRDFVVYHDPVPIRHQYGFGPLAERWSASIQGSGPRLLVHSADAGAVVRRLLPRHRLSVALHPVRSHLELAPTRRNGTLLVAGQYKPERDVPLLTQLGPQLDRLGLRGEIVGKGWPAIEGWSVSSHFIPERELDARIAQANVVLVPYRRYFQSGVAIRALELSTPVVLTRNAFAEALLGRDFPMLSAGPTSGEVVEVVRRVLEVTNVGPLLRHYRSRVDDSWRAVLTDGECE